MKKIFACAATVAGLVAGLCAVAAPSASAAPSDVIFINESGPGDAVASQVTGSHHVAQDTSDKSVTTGDISTWLEGPLQNSPLAFEVEGAEQDQGEES